jgi:hypothetical protein
MCLFGSNQREPLAKIKALLVPKHTAGACASPVTFIRSRIDDVF